MTKQKIFVLIPLFIIAGLLVYSWLTIAFTDIVATWRNYVGLFLYLSLLYLYVKDLKIATVAVGIFLIAGTFNLFTLTPDVTTHSYGLKILSVEIATPNLQLPALGIFVLFCILNFGSLINILLDYQEWKARRKT